MFRYFEHILVAATLISGLVYAAEALYRRVRSPGAVYDPGRSTLVEYSRSFFPVLFLVLFIRSFLFEPFRIPSGSMMPTLLIGDFLFVSKFAYGIRLPITHSLVYEIDDPERGDVIVFRYPADPSINYIKRLVGLPGDTVTYRNRRLFINGEVVPAELIGPWRPAGRPDLIEGREILGDAEHRFLLEQRRPSREGRFVVPEGHYFFMGDNRDNSQDSRFPQVGFVPEGNVVGKAVRIWLSWDFPNAPQWGRIGDRVR